MRWTVWWLTLALVACGESKSKLEPAPSGKAGKAGTSAAGGALGMAGGVAGSGEEAGAGMSAGGRSSAGGSGGAPASGDGGSSAGAGGSGAGGSGASSPGAGAGGAGLAGNASGGLASAGDGSGGEAGGPQDECATHEVCSSATRHFCCAIPEPTAAAYAASYYIGGLNHLTIERRGSDERCALLELVAPDASPVPYSLEIPEGWVIQGGRASLCGEDGRVSSPWRFAFEGTGSVSFSTPEMCAIDFDFTLFFESESGELEAARFQGQGLEIGGDQMFGCL
jgi:hypothetical protein